jgi:hypothetical protein
MIDRVGVVLAFGVVSALCVEGCGSSGASNAPAGGSGGVSASGGGGSGGNVGGSAGATGGSAGATGGAGGSPSDAGDDGSTPATDHVLISEVGIEPGGAEFVELWNPTSADVDLSDYYLADNSAYHALTTGPWAPGGTPGTDFLVRFPAGTTLAAGAVLVVASEPAQGNDGFAQIFGSCPTFTMNATGAALSCNGGNVPAMTVPPNGSVGANAGALFSNDREMIVLFTWDGSANTVKDVDYVTWGTNFDDNTRIDKTGISGYQPDTARNLQKPANQGVAGDGGASLSIERCSAESAETQTGGNGLTGHDETSEDMTTAFVSQASPSPGTKNSCLP